MNQLIKITTLLILAISLGACTGFQGYKRDKIVKYQCGIDTVMVSYLSKDWHKAVMISVNGGAPMLLSNVASTSGTRYVGGLYEMLDQDENASANNIIATTPKHTVRCYERT